MLYDTTEVGNTLDLGELDLFSAYNYDPFNNREFTLRLINIGSSSLEIQQCVMHALRAARFTS